MCFSPLPLIMAVVTMWSVAYTCLVVVLTHFFQVVVLIGIECQILKLAYASSEVTEGCSPLTRVNSCMVLTLLVVVFMLILVVKLTRGLWTTHTHVYRGFTSCQWHSLSSNGGPRGFHTLGLLTHYLVAPPTFGLGNPPEVLRVYNWLYAQ